jgi:hypothetical protein
MRLIQLSISFTFFSFLHRPKKKQKGLGCLKKTRKSYGTPSHRWKITHHAKAWLKQIFISSPKLLEALKSLLSSRGKRSDERFQPLVYQFTSQDSPLTTHLSLRVIFDRKLYREVVWNYEINPAFYIIYFLFFFASPNPEVSGETKKTRLIFMS